MILAVGLSPAWQQIMRFDAFHVGAVNRASEVHWCASGKAVNVALALARLGARVELASSIGGSLGRAVRSQVDSAGITGHWIDTALPTRVCTTIVAGNPAAVTELVENTPAMSSDELANFRAAYVPAAARAELVVLSGSLPAGAPADFYHELLSRTTSPAVVDFRGPELWHALAHRPMLVKPNREELARTVGRPLVTTAALRAGVRELRERGAQWVAITAGDEPVYVAGPGGEFALRPPRVEVVNPIGSGDCLAAGFAWGIVQGMEVPEALRLGVAAAALNVSTLLPAQLDAQAVRDLARQIAVEGV